MSGQNTPREYSRERRYYMDRASTRKVAARGSLLAVDQMEDRDLWRAGHERAVNLRAILVDGRDPRALSIAQDLESIFFELRNRGWQLQLWPDGMPGSDC